MKWHFFNPEHDMALAAGTRGFTPPAAGRGMRYWLGFLPAFWAEDDDVVIVDDVDVARTCAAPFLQWLPKVSFVTLNHIRTLSKEKPLGDKILSIDGINIGDYVVHRKSGIGIYRGLTTIEKNGMKIRYFYARF